MAKKFSKEEGTKKGQGSRSNFLIFFGDTKDKPKLTIVVAKKVAKKATDRNRMRRLIKESLRKKTINKDLKIIVKNNFSELKKQEVEKELNLKIK